MASAIERSLTRTIIRGFCWSGRNSHTRRRRAGEELANHLARIRVEHPTAESYIVAHSHGGVAASYALADRPELADGVVTIGTPFIHTEMGILSSGLVAASFMGWFMAAIVAFWLPVVARPWTETVAHVIFFMFSGALVLVLIGAVLYRSPTLPRRYVLNEDARESEEARLAGGFAAETRVLVLRSPADEAAGLLTTVQFLTSWLTRTIATMGVVLLLMLMFFGSLIALVASAILRSADPVDLISLVITIALGIVLAIAPPAVTLILIGSLVFGLDGPFVSLFAVAHAEPAPSGRATVEQVAIRRPRLTARVIWRKPRLDLAHSSQGEADIVARVVEFVRSPRASP